MKKVLLFLLLISPFFALAQNPVIISQPYKFQKYVRVAGSLFSDSTLLNSDSTTRVATTKWTKVNFAPASTLTRYLAKYGGSNNMLQSIIFNTNSITVDSLHNGIYFTKNTDYMDGYLHSTTAGPPGDYMFRMDFGDNSLDKLYGGLELRHNSGGMGPRIDTIWRNMFKVTIGKHTYLGSDVISADNISYGLITANATDTTKGRTVKVDTTLIQTKAAAATGFVPSSRMILNGYGILGGQQLNVDITKSVDTSKLQTILNFFPKGDLRYIKLFGISTLTGNTTIAGNTNPFFITNVNGSNNTQYQQTGDNINLRSIHSGVQSDIYSGGTQASIGVTNSVTNLGLTLNSAGAAGSKYVIEDSYDYAGGFYKGTYFSSNPKWLTPKRYVDSLSRVGARTALYGTNNYLPKYNSSDSTIIPSRISDDGSTVIINNAAFTPPFYANSFNSLYANSSTSGNKVANVFWQQYSGATASSTQGLENNMVLSGGNKGLVIGVIGTTEWSGATGTATELRGIENAMTTSATGTTAITTVRGFYSAFSNKAGASTGLTVGTASHYYADAWDLNNISYGSKYSFYGASGSGRMYIADGSDFGGNINIQGTAGNGYVGLVTQSVRPAGTVGITKIYRDSVGSFSYLNGLYRRTFKVPRAIDRTITYPYNNVNTLLADSADVVSLAQTLTNKTINATNNTISNIGLSNETYSAYSVHGNNTNATASPTSLGYHDSGELAYTGYTIVWAGVTAPSGTETHYYRWQRFGSMVMVTINLKYSVGGTSNTSVTIPLPTDCPAPAIPSSLTNTAGSVLTECAGVIQPSMASILTTAFATYLRVATVGFDVQINRATPVSGVYASINLVYFTN